MTAASPVQASSTTLARPPEYDLHVSGKVRLVLVINLSSFVAPKDAELFRHVRGSEAYATALRALHPHAPFGLDEATATLERDAYALRIFRSRLLHNHFLPTYRLGWDIAMRARLAEMGCNDMQRWQRCDSRIRLTRNGLAVVTLEQTFDDAPLITCTEQVLELPRGATQTQSQDQWSLGMTILRAFLDALGGTITLNDDGEPRTLHFVTTTQTQHTLRLDRYIIYGFKRIARDGRLVMPDELKRDYAATLASFMEGTLIECDGRRRYPRYAPEQAAALVAGDVASWQEELCLFTGESALLYYPLVGQGLAYVGGPLGLEAHAYSTYWGGLARGVEHLVAFHAEAQQTERRTTALLSQIPHLTRKVNDGQITAEDLAMIDQLAAGLSDIFDHLPEMRSMAVSTSAFRADYVRRKFEVLMDQLRIHDTLELVNTNVEQLDFFLSYYNDMRLQWQGQKTNNLGIILGAIVLFMAVSSFLADTFNVIDRLNEQDGPTLLLWIITAAVGLLIMGLFVWKARRLFSRRSRGQGPGIRGQDRQRKHIVL